MIGRYRVYLFNMDPDPDQGRPYDLQMRKKNRNLLFLKSWMFSMEGSSLHIEV
jgi:hypothetical protein